MYKLVHIQSPFEVTGKLPAQTLFLSTQTHQKLHVTFRRGARQMVFLKKNGRWKCEDPRFKVLSLTPINRERYLQELARICR